MSELVELNIKAKKFVKTRTTYATTWQKIKPVMTDEELEKYQKVIAQYAADIAAYKAKLEKGGTAW